MLWLCRWIVCDTVPPQQVPLIEVSYGGNPATRDLNPAVASELAALPPTPDRSAYGSFFERVGGTHWVGSQQWGAYANVSVSLDAQAAAAVGESATETVFGAAIVEIIGILRGALTTLEALLDAAKALLTPTICAELSAGASVTVCGACVLCGATRRFCVVHM